MRSIVLALVVSAAAPAALAQADARIVKFITESSAAEIGNVITKGREGAAKKYKDLPSPMPPNSMSESRLKGIIDYIKTDLQK